MRYFVLPQVSEVSARELSTAEDSTKDDAFEFTNPNRTDGDPLWSAGRHAVDISYVLDDVYLDVGGDELFVLPLRFPDGTSEAESIRTISLESGGPIQCLPDNTAFDPDSDCSRLHEHRLDQDGTRLIWRNDESANLKAIGFAAPNDIEAEPRWPSSTRTTPSTSRPRTGRDAWFIGNDELGGWGRAGRPRR